MATTSPARPAVGHKVRSLPGLPFLGNALEFRKDRLALFQRSWSECGDLSRYSLGGVEVHFANSVELAQDILVKHGHVFDKTDRFRSFARPLLGDGLLTMPNADHTWRRRQINAPFRPAAVPAAARLVADYTERLQRRWADGAVVDAEREMVRLTLWIVGKSLFDEDVLGEADELGAALTDAIHGFNAQASAVVPLTIRWPTPKNLRYRRAVSRLEKTFVRIYEERIRAGSTPDDWLGTIMSARHVSGEPFSAKDVRDEALNLFMPGHETTATGLTWALHLLSQHPQVHQRLEAEVDEVLQGRTLTEADLPRLPYALQVFKESMRLYPPVYMFSRQATVDVTVCGNQLSAGSVVIFSPYAMHRRPDYFTDPEVFDPDRFDSAAEGHLPRHAYMPFGGGRRNCIGSNYALVNGQAILATLASRVRLGAVPGQQITTDPQVTLRPHGGRSNGILMTVARR